MEEMKIPAIGGDFFMSFGDVENGSPYSWQSLPHCMERTIPDKHLTLAFSGRLVPLRVRGRTIGKNAHLVPSVKEDADHGEKEQSGFHGGRSDLI